MSDSFDTAEIGGLEDALRTGRALRCPRCMTPLDRRTIPPRPDVSYVRDRIWLACPRCHRAVVLDRNPHG
jgi:endogenous inhibitor of DNA gyrase (YacG/DUF329 family)